MSNQILKYLVTNNIPTHINLIKNMCDIISNGQHYFDSFLTDIDNLKKGFDEMCNIFLQLHIEAKPTKTKKEYLSSESSVQLFFGIHKHLNRKRELFCAEIFKQDSQEQVSILQPQTIQSQTIIPPQQYTPQPININNTNESVVVFENNKEHTSISEHSSSSLPITQKCQNDEENIILKTVESILIAYYTKQNLDFYNKMVDFGIIPSTYNINTRELYLLNSQTYNILYDKNYIQALYNEEEQDMVVTYEINCKHVDCIKKWTIESDQFSHNIKKCPNIEKYPFINSHTLDRIIYICSIMFECLHGKDNTNDISNISPSKCLISSCEIDEVTKPSNTKSHLNDNTSFFDSSVHANTVISLSDNILIPNTTHDVIYPKPTVEYIETLDNNNNVSTFTSDSSIDFYSDDEDLFLLETNTTSSENELSVTFGSDSEKIDEPSFSSDISTPIEFDSELGQKSEMSSFGMTNYYDKFYENENEDENEEAIDISSTLSSSTQNLVLLGQINDVDDNDLQEDVIFEETEQFESGSIFSSDSEPHEEDEDTDDDDDDDDDEDDED